MGSCNHHQNIDVLGENLKIVAWDKQGVIHGFELIDGERFVLAYLWHFEW